MADNPLAEAQRESAGASTFGKYNFQFHWALCEIIEKHKQQREYALLIEHHEDVVIADGLDASSATFEFYQVKNQAATFTPASLTRRKKGEKGKLKGSVLGKLLESCVNTSYEDRITKIGLVSSSGFSLKLDKDVELDVIKTGDIDVDELSTLTQKIRTELGIIVLPEHLQFIVPDIKLENQEDYVLGNFAKLVHSLFPNSQCNAVDIYRAVIDEMGRLGRVKYDYKDWERLIEKKSLTSTSLHNVITQHSSYPGVQVLKSEFDDIIDELDLNAKKKRTFRRNFGQLALRRAGFMSALDIKTTTLFKLSYDKVDESNFVDDALHIAALERQAIADGLDKAVGSSDEMLLEVIYCLLKA
ncbi:DUF4297 domain-containing protein [Vibrio splendidus]|uniref:DUF4297 domain-containing protein n=1 Tax=Vibrio splendidus TaxID=29497 RepID=UPI0024698344|nr:DUF4297 domain-containing protein [Vibrio splendidus]MDH5975178.1 DUF4297 domain-containing protein [Vibrio splendidus]